VAGEIAHNAETGQTLYFCTFKENGNVFLSNGESDEVWGTGGRDADNYDMAMAENAPDGHYTGDFDASISDGVYPVTVYIQAGGNPANADLADAQGVMYWSGTAEENIATIGDQLDGLSSSAFKNTNIYGPGE
jgi:hypothetical protein